MKFKENNGINNISRIGYNNMQNTEKTRHDKATSRLKGPLWYKVGTLQV